MVVTDHYRGWEIVWNEKLCLWFYTDNGEIHEVKKPRPCKRCGSTHSSEKPDPCLGLMDGFKNACCNHGAGNGYAGYGLKKHILKLKNKKL